MNWSNVLTIFKREFKYNIYSSVAYIIIIVFLIITAWSFTNLLFLFNIVSVRSIFETSIPQLIYPPIPLLLTIFIPAITMRTFAEEMKSGSIELLLTKPVTDAEIIMGKFLSALVVTMLAIIPTLFYVIGLFFLGTPDIGIIISTYVGILLLSGLYVGIGLLVSSLTEHQVIAFIVTFLILFFLFLFNLEWLLGKMPPALVNIFEYIGPNYHFSNMARGVIDTKNLIYLLSGITITLMLTRISLERRKW